MWLVIVLTGMGVGVAGAWLDVLVKWCVLMNLSYVVGPLSKYTIYRLGDLREGRCTYGFFYNQVACCSGLDREYSSTLARSSPSSTGFVAGEVCTEWKTWSEYLGVSSILGQSLLQAWVYVALAVSLISILTSVYGVA